MKVNGERLEFIPPMTVEDLIQSSDHKPERVAVLINGKIVPRAEYSGTFLNEEDSVVLVGFVGGG
ncbi:MAG: sulfur carrier protein ThiS [Methanomassiliicoccaceae archaeon]|nr:sulfur carrier protein ThiS [Methanomassiliicoccaceae archaeon]